MARYLIIKKHSNGSVERTAVDAETREEAEAKAFFGDLWDSVESGRCLYPGEVLTTTTSVLKIKGS